MRWLLFLMVFLSPLTGNTQIEVSGGFEKDTVVIGDEVSFTLSIEIDPSIEIIGVTSYFLDSIYGSLQSQKARVDTSEPLIPVVADFELVDNNNWNDLDNNGLYTGDELVWNSTAISNKRLLESTFRIRVWDPGVTVVPYPVVIYRDGDIQDQYHNQGQMSVFVAPPGGLTPVVDSLDIAPIKNIREEPVHFSDYMIYFLLIAIALLGGGAYWWYWKYKKDKSAEESVLEEDEIYVPPHEKAYAKLSKLREKELWQKGDIKKYQSELTYIIREYLEGRYDIAALESTTDEIIKSLMREMSNSDDVISLRRILQVADLVKFAKAKPEENIHEAFMNEAVSFVDRTKIETVTELSDDD